MFMKMRTPVSVLLVTAFINLIFCPVVSTGQSPESPDLRVVTTPAGTTLLDGTPIRLRLARTLSSKDTKTGESVDFEVLDDIKVGELIVIPRQSVAIATVTKASAAGRLGKGGKLDINIDYVRLATGDKIALRALKGDKGDNRTGTMTTALVASGILFFPAAPLFLFIKGKNVSIAKGTEVTAYVNGDFPIDSARFVPQTLISSSEAAAVTIKSTPEGADIEINGQFVGNTPSVIQLKTGEYRITLKRGGFAAWERSITVTPGSTITIDATMDKNP
jgi:hypothetical protein